MIKLMHNEIIKLIKKKSFYIVTLIFIFFCILTNIVYRTSFNNIEDDKVNVGELKEENNLLDLNNNDDLLLYVENLSRIEVEELKSEYSSSIQKYLIENFLYSYIYNKYESKYILNDENLTLEYEEKLEERLLKVKNEDWQYFLKERTLYLENRVKETTGIEQTRYNKLLELAQYRKDNNIAYDYDNYLNNSLDFLEENMYEYINLQNDENLTKDEEERLDYLNENMSIHEYVIDNKQDILNEHTLREVLTNFSGEFGLFVLIYTIMAAGSIVSEEYAKGTIKYLFTKPYKRRNILTSKLLVILMLIPLIMLFMSLIEIIIGGIILGFDSLKIPIALYKDGLINTYPVISYLVSLLLSSLPMYLVTSILAFMISTITLSTSAAITISFLFYLLGNVIANLALVYNLPIFKACISLYWNFSYIVTGSVNPYGVSLFMSIIIILIYTLIMLCITYVTFVKKDVKNI